MDELILEQMELAFGQTLAGRSLVDCSPDTIFGWDSLTFLNLVFLLEEALHISFDIEDIAEMAQGGVAIASIIAMKVGQQQ